MVTAMTNALLATLLAMVALSSLTTAPSSTAMAQPEALPADATTDMVMAEAASATPGVTAVGPGAVPPSAPEEGGVQAAAVQQLPPFAAPPLGPPSEERACTAMDDAQLAAEVTKLADSVVAAKKEAADALASTQAAFDKYVAERAADTAAAEAAGMASSQVIAARPVPGSKYDTKTKAARYKIFKQNLGKISRLNAKSGPYLAYGITPFVHMTHSRVCQHCSDASTSSCSHSWRHYSQQRHRFGR